MMCTRLVRTFNTLRTAIATAIAVSLLFVSGCTESDIPTTDLALEVPDHFPPRRYDNAENPLTIAGFELGRTLFYDPALSVDGTISCASCHRQTHGFSDPGQAVSTGVGGQTGSRNAPALSNLAWYPVFMADGGINHLEVMPLAPLTEPVEMGANLESLVEYLNGDMRYRAAFEQAFGPGPVTSKRLFYALAQFQSMLVSADAPYDRWVRGEASFTDEQQTGYDLFAMHCASCHVEPLFTDFTYANIGLDLTSEDPGRGRVTLVGSDSGAFRVPGLRNVALSAPYMHDGRFETLSEVLRFYANDVVDHGRLDERLSAKIPISESEQAAIIAFLETLTDESFISNPRFAAP